MRILLIGCAGSMGQEIIACSKEMNVKIVAGIDTGKVKVCEFPVYKVLGQVKEDFDAIIDFSTSKDHLKFGNFAKLKNVPYCLFSTNFKEDEEKEFKNLANFIPVFICNNASYAMNSVFSAVNILSHNLSQADIVIEEFHHKNKLDKPSGTAKQLEKIILSQNNTCEIHSFRVGKEFGTHKITFFLENEVVEISHKANSRKSFAVGAIKACLKLANKGNGLYTNILEL